MIIQQRCKSTLIDWLTVSQLIQLSFQQLNFMKTLTPMIISEIYIYIPVHIDSLACQYTKAC